MGITTSKKRLEMKLENEDFNNTNKEILNDILKLIETSLNLELEEDKITFSSFKEFLKEYHDYCNKYVYTCDYVESFLKIINIRYYYYMVVSKKIKNFKTKQIIYEMFSKIYRNYYNKKYKETNILREIELK